MNNDNVYSFTLHKEPNLNQITIILGQGTQVSTIYMKFKSISEKSTPDFNSLPMVLLLKSAPVYLRHTSTVKLYKQIQKSRNDEALKHYTE